MTRQPRAMCPHIAIFGRCNAGKSSLMNALAGQNLSLVSPVAGTTADPVEKSVEIPPLGPVVIIDTAGLDDTGDLGELRARRAESALASADLALLVSDGNWGPCEERLREMLAERGIPAVVVWNGSGREHPAPKTAKILERSGLPQIFVSALHGTGMAELVRAISLALPEAALAPPPMLRDLVPAGSVCLFVAPIDGGAPKARLIAPQAQALRDCLDGHAVGVMVQPEELGMALTALRHPPSLLVCDSQAVHVCAREAPPETPLTTYSILMARMKGDLATLAAGAAAIHTLTDKDRVCVSEVCAHHAQPDDIGRVKIPALLRKFTGAELEIHFASGRDFPDNLEDFRLVVHCGGCMVNRAAMLARIAEARRRNVPITNYGVAISLMHGVLERSLEIFPGALAAYRSARSGETHRRDGYTPPARPVPSPTSYPMETAYE